MGIMAETGQPQPPSRPNTRFVQLKTAQRPDIMHMTARYTAAMTTTMVIAMVLADIATVPAVIAEPPQHLRVHIMAEDTTAVAKRFAGSI